MIFVTSREGIDRRFYELCVLSELKNRLRLGDVWVVGSRQFKDFDTYLLDSKLFAKLRDQNRLSLAVVTDGTRYLSERCGQFARIRRAQAWGRCLFPDCRIDESAQCSLLG
jgi:hypothetical protein